MDPYSSIQSQLEENLASQSICLPLSEASKSFLKTWRPVVSVDCSPGFWNTESKGLCRLRVMIQDQGEPEFCLSYYHDNTSIFSTLYGNFPDVEVSYLPDIFTQRYPVTVIGVPGESFPYPPPQVYFYNEIGEKLTLTSIVDIVGIAINSEFHVIGFTPSVPLLSPIPNRRDSILRGLEICTGSPFVSELLLYLLVSSIQERSTLLGSFPINLTNLASIDSLKSSLQTLTRLVYLDFSLSFMNSSNLVPTKDPETEKLEPSFLQLPNNTLVIIDETKMTPGALTAKGLSNLDVLMQVVHSQSLVYNFGFSQINFPTDLRFLVCSTGKSILKIPTAVSVERLNAYEFSEEDRAYLESCSQIIVTLPESLIKVAQDYFVDKRKENKITPEDFHLILLLTRYTTQSHNTQTSTQSHWENALSLFSLFSPLVT